MVWRKLLIGAALMLAAGVVFADALPDQSTLLVTTSDGTMVGSGTYVGGALTLDVSSAYTGDATLTVTTRGGDTLTYEVSINADGTVTLAGGTTLLQDLNPSIAKRGGPVTISVVDPSTLTAPTLPAPGRSGEAHADHGIGHAPAAASVGVDHADAHASEGSANGHH